MIRKHKKEVKVLVLFYVILIIGLWKWIGEICSFTSVQGAGSKKELRIVDIQIKDKVYDKSEGAAIEDYRLEGVKEGDLEQEIRDEICLEASYEDEQAGTEKQVQVRADFREGSVFEKEYELTVEHHVKGTIQPKPVRLKLSQDLRVPYTQYREELLKSRIVLSYRKQDVIEGDQKIVDSMTLPEVAIMDEIPRVADGQPCMTTEKGLRVIGIDDEDYVYRKQGEQGVWEQKEVEGNYQFLFWESEKRNLIIEPQKLKISGINLMNTSFNAFQDQTDPQIFWLGSSGTLKLSPKDQVHYELVAYGKDWKGDLTNCGIRENKEDQWYSICLKAREPVGCAEQEAQAYRYSQSIDIQVRQDVVPPKVKISMGMEPYVTREIKDGIAFEIYSRKILEPSIQIRDWKDQKNTKRGSGLSKVSYTVWEMEEEICTEEQLKEELDRSLWKSLSCKEKEIKIPVQELELEAPCGYVILVKAEDYVGNSRIYSSNGVVVDIQRPSIEVRLAGDVGRSGIYRGNVQALVKVSDNDFGQEHKGSSGISEINWKILQNGKVRESRTEKIEIASKKDRIKVGKEWENITRTILIRKEYNSNDIQLHIKARDQAGNEHLCIIPIKIDITEPSVSISYQSREYPRNGFYFKADRTALVTVTERNFDPNGIIFYLKKDDEPMKIGTLSQLSGQIGIRARWKDSQKDITKEENYTDARIHQASLVFQEEGHYLFGIVSCKDLANWEIKKIQYEDEKDPSKKEFVIDKTPPVLKLVFEAGGTIIYPGRSEKKRSYQNKAVKVNILILEQNFVLQGNNTRVNMQVQIEKNGKSIKGRRKILSHPNSWKKDSNLKTSSLQFISDANYSLSIEYSDLAGNLAIYKKVYFTVDQTKPKGSILLGGQSIRQPFKSQSKMFLFYQTAQQIELTGKDDTSGVKQISYYVTNRVWNISELKKVKNWKKKASFLLKPQRQAIIYVKIQDMAGNIRYLRSKKVILDRRKPETDISILTEKADHDIFSKDVSVRISAYDPVVNDSCSGLKSVSYQVFNGKKITQSGIYNITGMEDIKGIQGFERIIRVDAKRNNSNDVTVRIRAVDQAGNDSVQEQKLKIDVSIPKISISYGNTNSSNHRFYNHSRIAKVVIRERNFDPGQVQFLINNKEENKVIISPWKSSRKGKGTDGHKHTCLVTFLEDGEYTFTVRSGDLAGNKSKDRKKDYFVIDKTVPEITVAYDRQKTKHKVYDGTGRTAVITIKEQNFREEDVKVFIKAALHGKNLSVPVISKFQTEGDLHRATLAFRKDGDYTFAISYRDQAGNQAFSYGPERFTVDTRPPGVKISGIKRSNQGTVAPVITCEDENLDVKAIEVTIEGYRHSKRTLQGIRSKTKKGMRIQLEDFAYRRQSDDLYTLKISVSDLAGNQREEVVVFSVNRFGSDYRLNPSTRELVKAFYCREPTTVGICEINPDPLSYQEIICSKDGKFFPLKEGEDYQILKRRKRGWYQYEYVIDRKNFIEDGIYVVTVYSKDKARNSCSNQAKGKKISFVVDQTEPSLVITGAEDGGRYQKKSVEIAVDAKDLICLEHVRLEVFTDGKKEPERYYFGKEQLRENYGVVRQEILSKDQWQTVRIYASDRAGNVREKKLRILVTENIWVLFYTNILLGAKIMAGICGLVLMTTIILKRVRSKGSR